MLSSAQRASGAPNRGISSPSFHGSGLSRTSHLQGWKAGGERPQPFQRGVGMLCPLSNKGTWISHTSVSPGAPGVLWTPASPPYTCLYFAHRGFVALCELFLGIEPHFALWKRLFCLVPRSHEGSIYQVGGAKIWCIAGTGYLSGTPKKASEDWPSEWFYMDDVPCRTLYGSASLSLITLR